MSWARNILITLPTDDAGHYYQDDLIQAFDAAFKVQRQRILDLEQALRLHLAVGPDDPVLIEPVEQQLANAQADVATRDRTIAAMAKKAMRLVPGCKDVDDAWTKLEKREHDAQAQITYLQTVSTAQVNEIRRLREERGQLEELTRL
jgi:hypothetical protein